MNEYKRGYQAGYHTALNRRRREEPLDAPDSTLHTEAGRRVWDFLDKRWDEAGLLADYHIAAIEAEAEAAGRAAALGEVEARLARYDMAHLIEDLALSAEAEPHP